MRLVQFVGFIPFLASAILTLVIALTFKSMHKRVQRRSPLADRKLGHVPGQQLVDRLTHHEGEVMNAIMLMYMSLPIIFMLWAGQRVDWAAQRFGTLEWIFAAGALLYFGYGFFEYRRHILARQKARDGLLAERVTGMQLNRLVAQGCVVLHDLPSETGNIDHIVIGSRGVYAVETKSFRKPKNGVVGSDATYQVAFDGSALQFPGFVTRKPIEQGARHADWLRRYLRESIGRDVPVIPAVALPGWYVVQSDDVWRASVVKVFSPLGDGANFMAKDLQRIEPEQRGLIATALAQRFPFSPA